MEFEESCGDGCIAHPAVGGVALMAAADGEADEATLAHLRCCTHCSAQVLRLRVLQRQLRHRLYRLFCPPTEILVDYCQGLLAPAERARLSHHIALCPHCAAEVALLEQDDLSPAFA